MLSFGGGLRPRVDMRSLLMASASLLLAFFSIFRDDLEDDVEPALSEVLPIVCWSAFAFVDIRSGLILSQSFGFSPDAVVCFEQSVFESEAGGAADAAATMAKMHKERERTKPALMRPVTLCMGVPPKEMFGKVNVFFQCGMQKRKNDGKNKIEAISQSHHGRVRNDHWKYDQQHDRKHAYGSVQQIYRQDDGGGEKHVDKRSEPARNR